MMNRMTHNQTHFPSKQIMAAILAPRCSYPSRPDRTGRGNEQVDFASSFDMDGWQRRIRDSGRSAVFLDIEKSRMKHSRHHVGWQVQREDRRRASRNTNW